MIETADRLHAESMDDNVNEDAQDAAYIEYHKVVEQIAATLQKVTRGAIDALTAKRMAHFKRDEIKGLVSRLA
jgi:hypothetical protein